MEWVELTCPTCQKAFPKSKKEHERQLRRGATRFFCKTSCQVKTTNAERYGDSHAGSKTTVELECYHCRSPFRKEKREVDRWCRKGRQHFFCSVSCHISNRNKHQSRPENLRTGGAQDEFSPFRWFLTRARQRVRKGTTDLDLPSLKLLWESQGGLCALSSLEMVLPDGACGWSTRSPRNASLDRVNHSMGYVKGNVRFVTFMANVARSNFSDQDLLDFCQAVASTKTRTVESGHDGTG